MNQMSQFKVHRLVEFVKQGDWCFDTVDVLEDLDDVLFCYGVFDVLSGEERELLRQELFGLGLAFEFAEVSRLAQENSLVLDDCCVGVVEDDW